MPKTPLGQRIMVRLREMDRDQKWLAGQLGRDPSAVSRWLDGSRPLTVADLERIALVLHRKPSWLLAANEASSDGTGCSKSA